MGERKEEHRDANRDPVSGAPGAHPLGTGIGAAAGGMAAGAAAGSAAGPAGTVLGAAAGALVGGLAGKVIAEKVDPTVEEAYWRENFRSRPYVVKGATYEDYGPAYRFGIDMYTQFPGRPFDDVESEMNREWQRSRGGSSLAWDSARHAARDSWQRVSDRVEQATPREPDPRRK